MKAVATIFFCGLWCSSILGDPGLFGNLTVFSRHSIITQPYPVENGIRTTVEQSGTSLQFECTVCDIGAPTEHCFEELGVCVTLSDTTVFVISTDGSLHGTPLSLDPRCTPRYLQMLGGEMVVVCHDPCFHFVTRTGSSFELHPVECGTGQEGIVTEALFWGDPYLFLIELNGNHIFESVPSAASPLTDITPHHNCTNHLSLYPLFSREHFLLWCNTTSGERVYIVDRSNRDHAPSVGLSSAPISSPDGRTFAAATGSTLKLYRSTNLAQYPGVKDFGVDITLCTYLNSRTVLIGLDGSGQILVHVDPFINSVGAEGLTTLPYTTSLSRVYQLITHEVYATSNKTGTLYNVLLFNITSGLALDPVSMLSEEPVNILFRRGVVPEAPSMTEQLPTSHPSSTAELTTSPAPSSTQVFKTSSTLERSDIPKPSPSDRLLNKPITSVYIGVAVAVSLSFAIIVMAITLSFRILYSKRQRSRNVHLPTQETDQEKGDAPTAVSSFGGDSLSSGIGTATQSFSSFAPDEDFASVRSSRGNSQSLYDEPVSETGCD